MTLTFMQFLVSTLEIFTSSFSETRCINYRFYMLDLRVSVKIIIYENKPQQMSTYCRIFVLYIMQIFGCNHVNRNALRIKEFCKALIGIIDFLFGIDNQIILFRNRFVVRYNIRRITYSCAHRDIVTCIIAITIVYYKRR